MTQLPPLIAVQAAALAARQLAEAWNSDCRVQRRVCLQQAWQEHAWYADAGTVLCGVTAMERHIAGVRRLVGAARFSIERLQVQGEQMQFCWQLRAVRTGSMPVMSGRCRARLGPDGRFSSLVSTVEATAAEG